MAILDKAKAAAERARGQAKHGAAQGRARLMEVQAQRQHSKLLRQLGQACYAEHSGQGTHEPVARAFAALDAHAQAHPQPLAPGRPQAVRQARDIMHPGAECIGEGDSVAAAAQKMRDLGVGSLPICGADDRLHGILTDRDIVLRCIAEGRDPAQVRAGDLAQETLFWADASASVGEVLLPAGTACRSPTPRGAARATADAATIRYLTHGHVALPAGDVAGDVVGVVGQRAGLGGAAGGAELVEELRVLAGELGPRPGTSSSQTIASTGHTGSQAPQSTHSPEWV